MFHFTGCFIELRFIYTSIARNVDATNKSETLGVSLFDNVIFTCNYAPQSKKLTGGQSLVLETVTCT
jgi:hypothetical protein